MVCGALQKKSKKEVMIIFFDYSVTYSLSMSLAESSALLSETQVALYEENDVMKAVEMILNHNYMLHRDVVTLTEKLQVIQSKEHIEYTNCSESILAQVQFMFNVSEDDTGGAGDIALRL
jgi:hypothetical protein